MLEESDMREDVDEIAAVHMSDTDRALISVEMIETNFVSGAVRRRLLLLRLQTYIHLFCLARATPWCYLY